MIGRLRIALAFAFVGLVTVVLFVPQLVGMKTGLFSEAILPRLWHRTILKALGLRVTVRGELSQQRPLLVASNHVSWTDIMVIGAYFDVRFIAKADVSGWPIMGPLAKMQRTVFVQRERKRQADEQANEIASGLVGGDAMVLFPEGTTADGNFLLPFKSSLFGAAELAIREGRTEKVFIQPVAIVYTRLQGIAMGRNDRALTSWAGAEALGPHLFRLLRQRAVDCELRFGEPIEFDASTRRKDAARQVETAVRKMMLEMLG